MSVAHFEMFQNTSKIVNNMVGRESTLLSPLAICKLLNPDDVHSNVYSRSIIFVCL